MTQAEWLDGCQFMYDPIRKLQEIVRKMDVSEPVTMAINKDGTSWIETHEGGHLYEFNVGENGNFNVRCDRGEPYFSDKDLAATSGVTNVTANQVNHQQEL